MNRFVITVCAAAFCFAGPAIAADYKTLVEPAANARSQSEIVSAYRAAGTDDALEDAVQALIRSGNVIAAWDLMESHGPGASKPWFKAQLAVVNARLAQAGTLSKLKWARTLEQTCSARVQTAPQDPTALECLAKFHHKAPRMAGGDKKAGKAALQALIAADPARGYLVEAEIVFPDKPERARSLVDKALSFELVYDEGLIQAARVYGYFKDWSSVDRALGRVDEGSPIAGMKQYQIGKLSAELKDRLDEGETALMTFLRGDTHFYGVDFRGAAHWRLGQIFQWKQDYALAQLAFERALAHRPSLKPAKRDLKAIKKLQRQKR